MPINYNKNIKKVNSLTSQVKSLELKISKLEQENKRVLDALHGTLHEVRRFSAEITNYSDMLNKDVEGQIYKNLDELSKTISYTSGLISSRLALTDLELNPRAIAFQTKFSSGIYKKFEKSSHILKQRAKTKQINIYFSKQSFLEIDALQSLELVPFILLENAIKYSPNNQTIDVIFDEAPNKRSLKVIVKSIGPMVNEQEIAHIFERGYRAENAKKLSVAGEGLGLFLVKFLCDLHSIEIKAKSDNMTLFSIGNIAYSNFEIELDISN